MNVHGIKSKWRSPPTKIVRAALDIKRDCALPSAKQEGNVTEKPRGIIRKKKRSKSIASERLWEARGKLNK